MPRNKSVGLAEAKDQVIAAIAAGATVEKAMSAVGRTVKTYENWRGSDSDFAQNVDRIRDARRAARDRGVDENVTSLGFTEFRKKFLGRETYPHMQAWIDALEGREPVMREGWTYKKRRSDRVIINTPPNVAKTQTITIDYVTYRLCMNPNTKVLVISQTREMAERFLYQIKKYLTDPQFLELQQTYAPDGDFKGDVWTSKQIYINGRDPQAKDASVQSVGWGSQIQGQRADLIIMDDVVTLTNAGEPNKMAFRIAQDVASRLTTGKLIIVGTRVGPTDLYEYLLNDENFNGRSPWTHLKQPMVSKFAEDPKDWATIWPRSSERMDENDEVVADENGLYPAWDGPNCAKKRNEVGPKVWALLYQQEAVAEDSTFRPECVLGSVTRRRKPGPLSAGAIDHPRAGMQGMYVIASMDPAMTGDTFSLVIAVDRDSKRRYLMNAWCETSPTPRYIREHIKSVTEQYAVNEWRIESNAFQLFLTHDEEITSYLANRGVKLNPHYTSRNKQDPDFGVASIATLFGSTRKSNDEGGREVFIQGSNLITLPDPDYSNGVSVLIEELISWVPGVRGKDLRQDGPMALWFAELAARDILIGTARGADSNFRESPWLTRGQLKKRRVVDFTTYMQAVGE